MFLQEDYTNGQQSHEKDVTLTNYIENTNQN